jgi:hypothetical protein
LTQININGIIILTLEEIMSLDSATTKITLEVTIEQAQALQAASELYLRMGLGQFSYLEELVRHGEFKPNNERMSEEAQSSLSRDIRSMTDTIKVRMGHPVNGSYGVGNRNVSITAHRCHEINKALSKAITEVTHPDSKLHSADRDGLLVRYTADPEPIVSIVPTTSA